MMQAGGKLDWYPMSHRRDQSARDLRAARECLCGHSAGAQFKTRAASGERLDRLGGGFRRRFPKNFQR